MKSIFQGEIDVFCAPYAVLNVLRHLFGLRLLECREILHEALLHEAKDPQNWRAILEQRTDYTKLVSAMLERAQKKYPLRVITPFSRSAKPDAETVWNHMRDFLLDSEGDGAVLFLFIRHLTEDRSVEIRHWTSAHTLAKNTLPLFDSSRNEGALQEIEYAKLVSAYDELVLGKVCIIPHAVYCVQRIRL